MTDYEKVRAVLHYLNQYAPETYVGVRDIAMPALERLTQPTESEGSR